MNYFFFGMVLLQALMVTGQNNIGVSSFEPEQVSLLEGPFKNAKEVDLNYILELGPDRLLSPFRREAGLTPKAESYPNWENSGLDGHIAGHYLSALSMAYATTKNEQVTERLVYMLDELEEIQKTNGTGYIGGVPGSEKLWSEIKSGNIKAGNFDLNGSWVPLYNIHKTYAGLRDAWIYAENKRAKELLINFTDWMLNLTQNLSNADIQELLISEHGGLNEVFADVAKITGEEKYLKLAYKFSHHAILDPLVARNDELTGMHANTQIPKVIGFKNIATVAGDKEYADAANFFWETVVNNRTVVTGGNSVREHFNPVNDFSSIIESEQGPETCNTYNMLRLSKMLFETQGKEAFIDYYEQALYNHILTTQHPEKGGFVYFTPMRPGHYRVYSQPETSFWCCVGSGLENHLKYNELIYSHTKEELYVNLYIPSEVYWEENDFRLKQSTKIPEEESSNFVIETSAPQKLKLKFRYPSWVKENALQVVINGEKEVIKAKPGTYFSIERNWKNGDKIEVKLPMHIQLVNLPDDKNYAALKYGPVVLAAEMGLENQEELFADESRGGHIADGWKLPLSESPYFIGSEKQIIGELKKLNEEGLAFSAANVLFPKEYEGLKFVPFYQIVASRYAVYLPYAKTKKAALQDKVEKQRAEREASLKGETIDVIFAGEQQPESDHFIKTNNAYTGNTDGLHWRAATGWFSYQLNNTDLKGNRIKVLIGENNKSNFEVLLNNELVNSLANWSETKDGVLEKIYEIPEDLKDSEKIIIKFKAQNDSETAKVYEVRLIKD